MALAAHLLLLLALTWGVSWKNSDEAATFSAELWTGQPKPAQPLPTPAPDTPQPTLTPSPQPAPSPVKADALVPDVDIALEEEKKRALRRRQKQAVREAEQAAEKAADLAAKKQAKLKEGQARLKVEQAAEKAADKADAEKAATAKVKAQDAARKQEQQKQAAAAAKAQRDANLARMGAQLGPATDGGSPKNTTAQGGGSSATYGGIIKAAVKPNVVFNSDITGNPSAKIEVRLTLDGTIISQRLLASSGNKAWDDAAMNGVARTRVMPRDVDGRIPDTTLILEMRPKN